MVPFYKQVLGFTMELKTQSNFKTTGLLQPWQTLCKIFSKCLPTRVTGWDQPPLQIMQMLYCFVNNIHVDYAEVTLGRTLLFASSSSIFDSISKIYKDHCTSWMITDEMKLTEHLLVSMRRCFRIEFSDSVTDRLKLQGTHRTPSAPRSANPDKEVAESSAPRRSTVIHLRLPERRSIRLTPPAPVLTVDKADEMILQDTLQVSFVEHKSSWRPQEVGKCWHPLVDVLGALASEEIEKMVDGQENIESPEVEIAKEKEVEISKEKEVELTNVVIPVNVNDEDEEITDEVYELKRREKGKIVEETRNSPILTPIRIS
ncbi:hypothetical protein Tco_0520707 [Tanacetum coccineum]